VRFEQLLILNVMFFVTEDACKDGSEFGLTIPESSLFDCGALVFILQKFCELFSIFDVDGMDVEVAGILEFVILTNWVIFSQIRRLLLTESSI